MGAIARLAAGWLLLACAVPLAAADSVPTLRLMPDQHRYALGRWLDILEDPGGQLDIEQLRSPPWSQRFVRSDSDEPNFGMTTSVYWVRLRVDNHSGYDGHWWLEQGYPNTQHLSLFLPGSDSGGDLRRRDSGILHPFAQRDLAYHLLVFDLPPIPVAGETLYLRFENGSNLDIALTLWKPKALVEHSFHQRLWQGFFLGCLLIMVAYNAFLWPSLGDPAYLWFLLFIAGVLVTQATSDGLAAQYLWPDQPWINAYAIQAAASFGFMCLLLFAMHFLDTRQRAPILHRLMQAELIGWLLLLSLLPWVSYGFGVRIAFALILLTSLSVLVSSLLCRIRGYYPARYILGGGLVLLLSLVAMVLTREGLLPSNLLTQQFGYQIGTIIFILSLSFALADRIKLLKREAEQAQQQALQTSQAHQQLVEQQNVRLEQQVLRRTAELERARDAADTANRAKSSFLATMSHELRTPLNVMLGYARLLNARATDDESRQGLAAISDSGNHLLTLVNEVLDQARVASGRLELSNSDFLLAPFFNRLRAMFQPQADERGLQFLLELAPTLPVAIQSDEGRLRQVLINLLGNAFKFTDSGQVRLQVRAGSGQGDDPQRVEMVFEVSDTGHGIASEQQQRIFAPFEQLESASVIEHTGGSGLGLAVSSRLVELMGGQLQLESQPGSGSRFWFQLSLPVADAQAPDLLGPIDPIDPIAPFVETADVERPVAAGGTGLQGDGRSLLIVDDHPLNRQLLLEVFKGCGFEMLAATTAEQALSLLQQHRPAAMFIDLRLPGMDGVTLIRQLRSEQATRCTPIIANSASAFESDRALAAGADLFLAKPLAPAQLLGELQDLLAGGEPPEPATTGPDTAAPGSVTLPSAQALRELDELLRAGDLERISAMLMELQNQQPGLRRFCQPLLVLSRGYHLRELALLLQHHRGSDVC